MRIYDISQEVFGCNVFPGDSAPEKEILPPHPTSAPLYADVLGFFVQKPQKAT